VRMWDRLARGGLLTRAAVIAALSVGLVSAPALLETERAEADISNNLSMSESMKRQHRLSRSRSSNRWRQTALRMSKARRDGAPDRLGSNFRLRDALRARGERGVWVNGLDTQAGERLNLRLRTVSDQAGGTDTVIEWLNPDGRLRALRIASSGYEAESMLRDFLLPGSLRPGWFQPVAYPPAA
jgi:hypothetical protein